nr:NAD(P)H-dependent oxidoreductase [Micromonospora sp. DSM 115978]
MSDVKVAVVYYSATGTLQAMAERVAEASRNAGAEVRLRQVPELAPQAAVNANERWREHVERTRDEPAATPDDVVWADAVLFGTPTRYGNISSQLKQFLDALGPQWAQG